jgi:hypothetical protein
VNIKTKILLISSAVILLLSLFFFINTYRENVSKATITRQQLSTLERLDVFTNTQERLAELFATDNLIAWQHLAQLHADNSPQTAYQLAEYFRADQQIKRALLWYQVAIRQHHEKSRVALANIYFDQHQFDKIKPLLVSILTNDNALALLYKLALQQGDLAFIDEYKKRLAQSENIALFRELVKFSVFDSNITSKLIAANISQKSTCLVDVQLFATNLTGLQHGEQLISAFGQHDLAKYICLATPKYIASNALRCQHRPSEKISCNATVWFDQGGISTRYIGVIVEQGGANVDNGIMYIDQQDNLDVLIHELSHFIGFVDEYSLPSQHQKCQHVQQTPFAHNLVVLPDFYQGSRAEVRELILSQVPWRSLIKNSTPILTKHGQGWQLATPREYQNEIGLFTSASCNKSAEIQAYKPLMQRTKLEYFELHFPQRYLDIINLAPRDYLMPSYHFNVSRDWARQGDYVRAREILKAIEFE